MLEILATTAPRISKVCLRNEASVRHKIKQQTWCPSRNLEHLMPPAPVSENALVPWNLHDPHVGSTMGFLSDHRVEQELICPGDCAQIQCRDWSLPCRGTHPVFNSPWPGFASGLIDPNPDRPIANEYVRRAILTAEVYRQSMTIDREYATRATLQPAPGTQPFQNEIHRYSYSAAELIVCGGLGSGQAPRNNFRVQETARVIQATCSTRQNLQSTRHLRANA